MALLKWSDWHEIGIPSIDDQHKNLFEALNRLHDAIQSDEGEAFVARTLAFLVDHTVTHFQDEEAQMALAAYPGLAEHQAEHSLMLKRVDEAQTQYLTDHSSMKALALGEMMATWAPQHILGMDELFAAAVKAGTQIAQPAPEMVLPARG